MLASTDFWNAVAFFTFLAVAWRFGAFGKIVALLDGRSHRVRAELDEARRLRAEADALLAAFKTRQAEAEREAQDIVAAAREEAERIAQESQVRVAEFVKRRTASAEAKIAQAEVQATQQVRAAAADAAIRVSEIVLRDQMSGPAGEELMRRSLGEVRGRLNS